MKRWLNSGVLNDENASGGADVEDAFSRDLQFGTGGLRGKLGIGPNRMNVVTVGRATQGLANYLKRRFPVPSVAICRDSRHGSSEFAQRAAEVLAANGVKAYLYRGAEPTPALSFAVRALGCSAGIVITASHNPREYNGYKVYGSDGCQITVVDAEEIQADINALDYFDDVRLMDFGEGIATNLITWIPDEMIDTYCDAVLAQSTGINCSGLRIAYTPLNGTGLECVRRVLDGLGVADIHVVSEQADQNGDFPTCPKPNPEIKEALDLGIKLGESVGADILLATDPDADRVGVAIPHGSEWRRLTGNELGLLLLDFLASRAEAAGEDVQSKIVITTIVSAPMADDLARAYGFELRRTLTGFKFCGEQIGMLERQGSEDNFLFGFEESCGYLAGTYVRDKDAIEACMLACELTAYWKARGLDLWDALQSLYGQFGYWGNEQVSVEYEGPDGPKRMRAIMDRLRTEPPVSIGGRAVESIFDYLSGAKMPAVNSSDKEMTQNLPRSNALEMRLSGGSRVLVRPSGTEPKIKAYAFAKDKTAAGAQAFLDVLVGDIRGLLNLETA